MSENKDKKEEVKTSLNYALPVEFTMMENQLDLTPTKGHESDAGYDLKSRLDVILDPGKCRCVPTGLFLVMPKQVQEYDAVAGQYISSERIEAQVRSKSGIANKHQVFVLNSPGTIDVEYIGEVGVILYNLGPAPYVIKRGDKIAQLVFNMIPRIDLQFISKVKFETITTDRGADGFGSTGV